MLRKIGLIILVIVLVGLGFGAGFFYGIQVGEKQAYYQMNQNEGREMPIPSIPTNSIPLPPITEIPSPPPQITEIPSPPPQTINVTYDSLPPGLGPLPPNITFIDGGKRLKISEGFTNALSQEIKPFSITFYLNDQQMEDSIVNPDPLEPGQSWEFEKILPVPEGAKVLNIKIAFSD